MANPIRLKSKKALLLLVCVLFSLNLVFASAQGTVVRAEASNTQPAVGSSLTVTLKIEAVQNLAGIDVVLTWDSSVLSLQDVTLYLGVESHPDGVLHGTNINRDASSLNSGDIYVSETKVAGSYELVAQSVGSSNPAFSGSGTIATLTFNVLKSGAAQLSLQSELADHPAQGDVAQNIDHTDIADTVVAIAQGASPSPSIPEYPLIAMTAAAAAIATAVAVLAVKKTQKH